MKEDSESNQEPMSEGGGPINVEVDTSDQEVVGDVITVEAQRSTQVEIGDTSFNRWFKKETDALLKITRELNEPSEKAALKGSMWKMVSMEMEKLGYKRTHKQCRKKYENLNNYNKRIKKGQVKRQCDWPYRFADQLESLNEVKAGLTGNGNNQDAIALDAPTPAVTMIDSALAEETPTQMLASSIEGYEGSKPKKRG